MEIRHEVENGIEYYWFDFGGGTRYYVTKDDLVTLAVKLKEVGFWCAALVISIVIVDAATIRICIAPNVMMKNLERNIFELP